VPPCRGPWAACTDSRREHWTTGRARVAYTRAFPTMGLARRRDAETRLTTQGPQRSSGRVIGLFDGARDRRARRLDGRRGRRGHGRHRGRCARARVARRLDRRRERAAIGRGRVGRAGARLARGVRGRRNGAQCRRGDARGRGRRDRAMAPRRSHGAVASPTTQGAPRRPMRGTRHDDRCARTRARAPAGAGATRSGAVARWSAAPGKAPKPSRPPTTSAAAAVAASSDPVAASPAKAARRFLSLGIRAVLLSPRATPRERPHGPAGRMSQR
jgi:hypothetical protein